MNDEHPFYCVNYEGDVNVEIFADTDYLEWEYTEDQINDIVSAEIQAVEDAIKEVLRGLDSELISIATRSRAY